MLVAGAVFAGVVSWAVAPLVAMRRRGTVDQQVVAAMRAEPARPVVRHPEVAVPAPRTALENRSLAG